MSGFAVTRLPAKAHAGVSLCTVGVVSVHGVSGPAATRCPGPVAAGRFTEGWCPLDAPQVTEGTRRRRPVSHGSGTGIVTVGGLSVFVGKTIWPSLSV